MSVKILQIRQTVWKSANVLGFQVFLLSIALAASVTRILQHIHMDVIRFSTVKISRLLITYVKVCNLSETMIQNSCLLRIEINSVWRMDNGDKAGCTVAVLTLKRISREFLFRKHPDLYPDLCFGICLQTKSF